MSARATALLRQRRCASANSYQRSRLSHQRTHTDASRRSLRQLLDTLPPAEREWLAAELVQLRAAVDASDAAWKEDHACDGEEDEEEDEAGEEE